MWLKHIYLYLSLEEYPDDLVTPFGFRTRYLCNFVGRSLKKLKHHTEGFNAICIEGNPTPQETCPIMCENAAVPTVAFDRVRYESLTTHDLHEFLLGMLTEGLQKCARHHQIPLPELLLTIEEFRAGGYKNEWIHKTKLLRPTGVRATLACALTPERFTLTLRLERHGATIFDQVILETKPDEIIFAHQFKDVILEDEHDIVVTDKFGRRTFAVDLRTLDN